MRALSPQTRSNLAELPPGARDLLAQALRKEVAVAGELVMEAVGSSMVPTVPGGSVVRVEPLRGTPRVDELIAFVPARGNALCCHRVVAIESDGRVVTQGDRSGARDEPVPAELIIGMVRHFTLGGKTYAVGPGMARPRPSAYRAHRQRLVRLWRRLRST